MASLSEELTLAQHMRESHRRARNTSNHDLKREAIEQWRNIPVKERPPLFMHFLSGRVGYDDFQMSLYEWDRKKCRERRQEAERNAPQEICKREDLERPMVNGRSLPSTKQGFGAQEQRNFGVDEDEWLLTYGGKLSFREQKRRSELLRKRAASQKPTATRSDPIVIDDDSEPSARSREPTQLPTPPSSSSLEADQPLSPSPSPGSEDRAWAETLNLTLTRAVALRFAEQTSTKDPVIIVDLESDEENDGLEAQGLVRFRHFNKDSPPRDSLGHVIPEISLDDIKSYTTQWQIQEIRKHVQSQTIRDCHAALMLKQGDWMAAKDFLIQQEIREGRRDALIEVSRQPTTAQDKSQAGFRGPSLNSLLNVPENTDLGKRDKSSASGNREDAEMSALVCAEVRAKTTVGASTSWQDQQQYLDNASQDKQARTEPGSVALDKVVNDTFRPSQDLVSLGDRHSYTHDLDLETKPIMASKYPQAQVAQSPDGALPQIRRINPMQHPSMANNEPSKATFCAALKSKPAKTHTSPCPVANPSLAKGSAITLPHRKSIFLAGRRTLFFEYNQELAYCHLNLDEDGVFDADAFAEQHFLDDESESDSDDESPSLGGEKGRDAGSVPSFAVGVVETHASRRAQGKPTSEEGVSAWEGS